MDMKTSPLAALKDRDLLKTDALINGEWTGSTSRFAVTDPATGQKLADVANLGAKAEIARELSYRLYALCERKKRAPEALAYNGLGQSWPEIIRLAQDVGKTKTEQGGLFGETEE